MAVIFYPPRNTGGGGGGAATWGSITGTLSAQTDLQTALNAKADTSALSNYLLKSSNLSDVANVVTARSNLGLGSIALQNSNSVTITGGNITGLTSLTVTNPSASQISVGNGNDITLRTAGTGILQLVNQAGTVYSRIVSGSRFDWRSNSASTPYLYELDNATDLIYFNKYIRNRTAGNSTWFDDKVVNTTGVLTTTDSCLDAWHIVPTSGVAIENLIAHRVTTASTTVPTSAMELRTMSNGGGVALFRVGGGINGVYFGSDVTSSATRIGLIYNNNTGYDLTFPPTVGTNGQVLQTNGTGTLSWVTPSGGLTGFTGSINTTSPNATINVSRLLVAASSTNADAAIVVKGTGSLMVNMPDSTATGGNKRGTNAVDLQFGRGSASQVAGGQNSAILGGLSNTTQGQRSAIVGGIANTTNSNNSAILGGSTNTTSTSDNCTVLGGANNTSSGSSSAILGGDFNQASSTQSAIVGGNTNLVTGGSATSVIVGGESNTISASIGSVILGGEGFTAGGNYVLGFNANNQGGSRNINIGTVTDTVVFNNADLWLSNNDNVTSVLRFYEQYNAGGSFPNGANFVGLRAPNSIASDITWVLPNADGTNGQALQTDGSGNLSWGGPTFKTKPADQSVTNSTVVINDNTFSFDIGTSGSWYLELNLLLDIPASTNFRWRLSGPAGATGVGSMKVGSSATEAITSDAFADNILTVTAASGTNLAHVEIFARVIAGGTAGTVVLQWAQGTANPGSLTVRGGRSRMIASRNS